MIASLVSLFISAATAGKRASFFLHSSSLSGQRSSRSDDSSSSTVKTLLTSRKPLRKSATRESSGLSISGEAINQSCSTNGGLLRFEVRRNHRSEERRV